MPEASWGGATAKGQGGGESDPNILSLKEANRIRLLDPAGPVKWRQHFIPDTNDDDKGRSVVCPKGPDGRDASPCPLCMKPVDQEGKQRFAISRRYAANVWDYDSNGVKILIAGPQVFEEFDAAAAVGLNPTEADYLIHKMGKGIQTSYKVVRGNSEPLAVQITPDMLLDRSKYDTPDSPERIFEVLEQMGWDYDALEMPTFTLDKAESYVMPYGKHKGMTIEQLCAMDVDYVLYLHGAKKSQGQYGDPVFVAMQTVLEDRGEVAPIENMPTAPPRAAAKSAESSPAQQASQTPIPGADPDYVTMIGPDGNEAQVPVIAQQAMLNAGFTMPPEPEPVASEYPKVLMSADASATVTVENAAVEQALRAAGYIDQPSEDPAEQQVQAQESEPDDADEVAIEIAGTKATMLYGQAKALIASGAATLLPTPDDGPEPAYQLPADDDMVQMKVHGIPTPIPMKWSDAKIASQSGAGKLVDEQLAAAWAADKQDDKAVASSAADAPTTPLPPAVSKESLDPSQTTQNPDGTWTHPALGGESKKTKGAVTQALNRLAKQQNVTPGPAAAAAPTNGGTGKEAKLDAAKNLLAAMPEVQGDFKVLLALFQEVAGKRNITDFDESELDKLITRLQSGEPMPTA